MALSAFLLLFYTFIENAIHAIPILEFSSADHLTKSYIPYVSRNQTARTTRMAQKIKTGFVGPNLFLSRFSSVLEFSPLAYGIAETCNALKSYVWNTPKLAVAYEAADVDVDIVFVHGFGGDQRETWTCREGRAKVYWWDKDYLNKDVQNLRVLIYGYNVTPDVLEHFPQTIREESRLLLDCLEQKRRSIRPNRPLIFIAHGLGGLIVKAALIRAFELSYEQAIHKDIFFSIRAVLFYGTPHKRTSQSLGKNIAQIAARSLGQKCEESLENDADLLALQLDRYKSLDRRFKNCSFYKREKKPISEAPQWITWVTIPLDKPLDSDVNIKSTEDKAYSRAVHFIVDACKTQSTQPGDFELGISLNPSKHLREAERLSKSRPDEAEFKFQQELGRSEDNRGLCGPYTLLVLSSQARHYRNNSASDKALCCYRRVYLTLLANYTSQLTSSTSIAEHNLAAAARDLIHGAQILGAKAQYAEAVRFLEMARDIFTQSHGPDDRATLMLSAHIATFYVALGRLDDADGIYNRLRIENATDLKKADLDDFLKKQEFIDGQRQFRKAQSARRWSNVYGLLFEDENRLPIDTLTPALPRSMSADSFAGNVGDPMTQKMKRAETWR